MPQSRNSTKVINEKEDGVVILLLGDTGVGKSLFINAAAGEIRAKVGQNSNLESCTLRVEYFVVPHHKDQTRKVCFVDTPGFNNSSSSKSDRDILREIIDWLNNSRDKNAQFGGIVYLHDLDEHRVQPSGQNTKILTKLYDSELAHCVVLATVKGDAVSLSEAHDRGTQFKAIIQRDRVASGLKTCQFMRTKDSAWDIVDTILQGKPIKLRLIQEELDRIYKLGSLEQPVPKLRSGCFSCLFGRSKPRSL